ncbi:N-acetyltransferase family protein [Pseudonocardia sp.]|uniref:GNAT family N-acetyltransferase n=1 Tax=Pseudonocardia sp. TaxID=60912 RepID=UPI003D0ED4E0
METTVARRRRRAAAVRTRPLRRDDPAVDAVFAGLSERSRYLRFHAPAPRLTAAVRRHLHDVDGRHHAGLVAEVRGVLGTRAVGISRIIGGAGDRAELAVAVVDAWQGRGVGRMLLTDLAVLARDLGHRELHGDVLAENTGVVTLLRSVFPGTRHTRDGGVVHVRCPLTDSVEITHEDLLADLLAC